MKKHCKRCQAFKSVNEFPVDPRMKSGRANTCCECKNDQRKLQRERQSVREKAERIRIAEMQMARCRKHIQEHYKNDWFSISQFTSSLHVTTEYSKTNLARLVDAGKLERHVDRSRKERPTKYRLVEEVFVMQGHQFPTRPIQTNAGFFG